MKLKSILLEAELDQIEKNLENEFGQTLQDLINLAKAESGNLKTDSDSIEEGRIDESLGPLAIIGFILAMPRVVELLAKPIGKFIKTARQLLKPKSITNEKEVAEAILHFAHKWHRGYVKIVKWILEVSGTFKKAGYKTDVQKEKAANLVYYTIIAALAVNSGIGTIHAFEKIVHAGAASGTISLAALETAMTSLKSQEVVKFIKQLIS